MSVILYPTLEMSDVDNKLRASLGRIRDTAVRYAEKTIASEGASGLGEDNLEEDDSEHSTSEDDSASNKSGKDDDDDLGLDWASGSESDGDDAPDRPGACECN